jgi:pyruvate/2-oxoglutarate dehydrogenase complex dihydrolipoamide acyltransferase (E2) component
VIDVIVPKWGLTMEEGVLVAWLKQVGDPVGDEEPIAELEADKIDGEIMSPAAGTLAEVLVAAGTEVEPGQVIARVDPS